MVAPLIQYGNLLLRVCTTLYASSSPRHSFSFLLEKNIISYYHRIESENCDSSLANEGTVYSGRLEINKAIEECRAKGTAISAPQRP